MTQINDRLFSYNLLETSGTSATTDANNSVQEITINYPDNYLDPNPKISILEKVNRILDLQNPDLVPISNNSTSGLDFISLLASNLGYSIEINRSGMAYTGSLNTLAINTDNTFSATDVEKYLRFVVANLPNFYKIKGTNNSFKVMLYSFGLDAEIETYFTDDYNLNWKQYNDEDKFKNIPDNFYPTPHIAIRISIDNSISNISFDKQLRTNVINAVNSIRPINVVMHNLDGYLVRVLPPITVNMNTRVNYYCVIT